MSKPVVLAMSLMTAVTLAPAARAQFGGLPAAFAQQRQAILDAQKAEQDKAAAANGASNSSSTTNSNSNSNSNSSSNGNSSSGGTSSGGSGSTSSSSGNTSTTSSTSSSQTSTEQKDSKTTDAKPGDAKPGDAKAADAKPADGKPAEAKAADGKPAEEAKTDKKDDATTASGEKKDGDKPEAEKAEADKDKPADGGKAAAAKPPEKPQTYSVLQAAIYDLNIGQPNDAIEKLKPFIAKNGKDPQAHYVLATAYVMARKYQEATAEYNAVLKLVPATAKIAGLATEGLKKIQH